MARAAETDRAAAAGRLRGRGSLDPPQDRHDGALYAAAGSDPALLVDVAREFSPRIEVCGPREITLDLSGLARLFGDARAIAGELRRTAADRGLQVRVAIAGSRTAARLLVRHRAGITVVEPGRRAPQRARARRSRSNRGSTGAGRS